MAAQARRGRAGGAWETMKGCGGEWKDTGDGEDAGSGGGGATTTKEEEK